MTWTNAGHPPPILVPESGHPIQLDGHGILFGFTQLTAQSRPRRDQQCDLRPGDTVVLYTDGLVERRGDDLDNGTARLLDLLTARRHLTVHELVDEAVDTLGAGSDDDIVVLAVRVDEVDEVDEAAADR